MNISESGLLAEFPVMPELFSVGELTLSFGEGCVGLKARVVRAVGKEAGLAFLLQQDGERATIRDLLQSGSLFGPKDSSATLPLNGDMSREGGAGQRREE